MDQHLCTKCDKYHPGVNTRCDECLSIEHTEYIDKLEKMEQEHGCDGCHTDTLYLISLVRYYIYKSSERQ